MSEQLPARHSSAPTLPTRSDNAPLDFLSQLAQRYFGNVYANDGQPPLQHEGQQPSTLQNALGYLADRALLRTSITIGSDTADAGNQEPSPLAKAADYVSRSLFAPEMLDSSSSGSSIGVTIVRPPSRSCLRSARSTINVTDAADDEPNPPKRVPRTASGSRVQYRVRLIPSSDRQRAASTQSLPPGSGPDYYVYLPGMRSWGKLLTPSASCLQCHPECSCLGPMDAYRAASAQMNPYGSFGMSSTLPFWPLPQYPYHYYSPSATVPPFQAWASGQRGTESSTDGAGSTNCVQCKWEASQWPSPHASSNCLQCKWEESQWPSPHAGSKCVQCRWEAGQWPSSPAGAFRDFSTLVQAANQEQSSAVHDFSTLVQTAPPGSRRVHTTHNLVTLADVPEEMDGGAEGAAVDPLVVVLKWPGFAEAPAAQGLAQPPTSNPEGPNAVPWAEQIASQSHLQDPAQVDTSALQAQRLQTDTAPRVQQGVTAPPVSEPQGPQPAQPLPVAQLPGGVFGSDTGPMAEVAAPGKGNGPTDTAAAAAVEDSELHDSPSHDSPSHDSPSHESESHESALYLSGSQGSTSSGGIANQNLGPHVQGSGEQDENALTGLNEDLPYPAHPDKSAVESQPQAKAAQEGGDTAEPPVEEAINIEPEPEAQNVAQPEHKEDPKPDSRSSDAPANPSNNSLIMGIAAGAIIVIIIVVIYSVMVASIDSQLLVAAKSPSATLVFEIEYFHNETPVDVDDTETANVYPLDV